MIVDYSLFTPLQPLPDGTLWIIEQLPGKTHAADVTDFLRRNGRQEFHYSCSFLKISCALM
jgi:hypothetical protein